MTRPSAPRGDGFRAQMAEHEPDRPWLWRRDWASGHVEATNPLRAAMVGWVPVLLMGLTFVAVALLVRAHDDGATNAGVGAFLVTLLVVALAFLVVAVQSTVRHLRYRRSVLELGQVPFLPGDRVYGVIRAPRSLRLDAPIRVALDCRRGANVGGPDIRWREDRAVPPAEIGRARDHLSLSFSFPLPSDQPPTSKDPDDARAIAWVVSATGEGGYEAAFEVPVFASRTKPRVKTSVAPDAGGAEDPPTSAFTRATAEQRGYHLESSPEGIIIHRPPERGPVGCLAFVFALAGLTFAATQVPAMASLARQMLPWMYGVAGLAALVGLANHVIDPRRLSRRGAALALERGVLGWSHTSRIPVASIDKVVAKAQAGHGVVDWNVDVMARGSRHRVARALKDPDEAKWLAAEIQDLVAGSDER